ncbi:MAG TPA: alpha-2-macroglobulin [Bacteroidetes bacterium]|nr:alpha-2-macroglobulin [Bacteroidota bacterium]
MKYLSFLNYKTTSWIFGACLTVLLAGFTILPESTPYIYVCQYMGSQQQIAKPFDMKFDYDKAWQEVEKLEKEGLPKSALEKVNEIFGNAKAEGRSDHFIKALIFKGKYESQLEEDGFSNAINRMEKEMEAADGAVKATLQSMLAEMYQQYLDNNRWQFQNRTQTVGFKNADIRTWTMEQLVAKSDQLFWASLKNNAIKTISIDDYKLLLNEGENDEGLRPTLYDFLAHRALDHFMNERNYLTQPAYKFNIDDEKAFAPSKEFAGWQINTKDTASQKYQTLLLFQELLKFRASEKMLRSPSLLDADLKRLSFVHANFVGSAKEKLYLKALQKLKAKYDGSKAVADVNHAIAAHYYQQGQGYKRPAFGQEDLDDRKWLFKEALALCNETISAFPNTVGATKCTDLKRQILAKYLRMKAEQVNLPGQPFLAKITYRNLPKVWLKIIPFDENNRKEFEKIQSGRNSRERTLEYFNGLQAVKNWSVILPDEGDYRQHSTEIKMDELPLGQYLVMVAENENFVGEEGGVGYLFTQVSKLGYWQRQGGRDGLEFVVFDRKTGQPMEGVTAEFWVQSYNSILRKYEKKKRDSRTTDSNGFVKPRLRENEDRNFSIRLKKGKDELIAGQNYYYNSYRSDPQPYQQTQFFIDRGIYRPGQTVYFKGIALAFDSKRMPTILTNKKVTITFKDANYQDVEKLELRSNEYGTFSGQFMAPRGGLLGNMQIVSSIGGNSKSFRVEEYKRPKFEVSFEPVKESYRLNDEVKVTGKAAAYAGNNVDGAEVTWRVVRKTHFPWWWGSWRWNPWRGETMEIANGTASTDEKGNFKIAFKAIPDVNIPKENKPEFSYKIMADVTDITGETQSNQTQVKVGYIALQMDIPIAQQINIDSLRKIDLVTKNLNGEFEAAKGTIKIELLKAPNNIFIDRYWEQPDMRVISEKEFKNSFPQYTWGGENKPENWEAERIILHNNFDTEKSKDVRFPKIKLTPGQYVINIKTADKYGEKVELKKYFSIFDLNKNTPPKPAPVWHFFENKNYEPNEAAKLYFASSKKAQPILLEYIKDNQTLSRKWLTVNELKKDIYKIKESDRGGVSYLYSWAGDNRTANISQAISIPWSNKELSIEYGTFRDKLQPGQEEEWTIKIKGPKGEKVAAEMVAGMYDASLDAFAPNSWGMNIFPTSWTRVRYSADDFNSVNQRQLFNLKNIDLGANNMRRRYDRLNWYSWYFQSGIHIRGSRRNATNYYIDGVSVSDSSIPAQKVAPMANMALDAEADMAEEMPVEFGSVEKKSKSRSYDDENAPPETNKPSKPGDISQIKIRSNLNETVFFFPNLMTDEEGNILIKFKMNEALTKWKFLGLAHTKDLKTGSTSKEIVTQKDLMVVPNPPRFFRENDEIEFTAKVVNLTDKPLSGNAELQLVNPLNSMPVYKWLDNPQFNQHFTVEANQSARLAWRFKVPDVSDVPVIEHTVVAVAGEFSDGERAAVPVLSNRMLVTETKPLPVRGHESKIFTFESLKNNTSPTLRHQGLTLEFTQNPAWYAVQALPYLMEYPYECTEQIFSRFYANSLATSVANSHPKIKSVFDKWRDFSPPVGGAGGGALMSNLSKNQELKTALLEETPWVLNAQSEELQKKNIALLFDLNRMAYEQEAALKKLQDRQMPGGGWAWFPGGPDSRYITEYIVEGLGHLQKLNVRDIQQNPATWQMVQKAVAYCDARMVEQYERLEEQVKKGHTKWEDDHLDYMAAHYLYTRSFFLEDLSAQASLNNEEGKSRQYLALKGKAKKVHEYYLGQAEKYWLKKGMYSEGMLALAMHRNGKAEAARKVTRSLKERSLNHEELGMYWKYPTGWWWYQAPIETHALMIEAFSDITDDTKAVDDLKVWLLKNKQTNHWKTTKATAAAVYALLSSGDNWLLDSEPLDISFPAASDLRWENQIKNAQANAEAGTGYFKTKIDGGDVKNWMSAIHVSNPNNVVAWGAMYWQYFEQLDNIKTFEETPLTIKKQLFRVENSPTGEVIRPVKEGDALRVGEKLKVRIELRVDRDMEYVHMKDMRASGFEPINVLSSYKWQGGLGYYESTRDVSTNFFFGMLPKGTHVFEYPLRVVHNGDFSNGITTVQCMYAPEFTSHSEGVRVVVK